MLYCDLTCIIVCVEIVIRVAKCDITLFHIIVLTLSRMPNLFSLPSPSSFLPPPSSSPPHSFPQFPLPSPFSPFFFYHLFTLSSQHISSPPLLLLSLPFPLFSPIFSLCCPFLPALIHFLTQLTTLENTPPEFLLAGTGARQAYSADTFPLGWYDTA